AQAMICNSPPLQEVAPDLNRFDEDAWHEALSATDCLELLNNLRSIRRSHDEDDADAAVGEEAESPSLETPKDWQERPPLLLDATWEEQLSYADVFSVGTQLRRLLRCNRRHGLPFLPTLCGLSPHGRLQRRLDGALQSPPPPATEFVRTSRPWREMAPPGRALIFISPDAMKLLTCWRPDAVYVLPCAVNRTSGLNRTLARQAVRSGALCVRLPLDALPKTVRPDLEVLARVLLAMRISHGAQQDWRIILNRLTTRRDPNFDAGLSDPLDNDERRPGVAPALLLVGTALTSAGAGFGATVALSRRREAAASPSNHRMTMASRLDSGLDERLVEEVEGGEEDEDGDFASGAEVAADQDVDAFDDNEQFREQHAVKPLGVGGGNGNTGGEGGGISGGDATDGDSPGQDSGVHSSEQLVAAAASASTTVASSTPSRPSSHSQQFHHQQPQRPPLVKRCHSCSAAAAAAAAAGGASSTGTPPSADFLSSALPQKQQTQKAQTAHSQHHHHHQQAQMPPSASVPAMVSGAVGNGSSPAVATCPRHQQQQQPASYASHYSHNDRVRKRTYRIGLNFFNRKPDKGIQFLIGHHFIQNSPSAVARFLLHRKGLCKQVISNYLGQCHASAFVNRVCDHFLNDFDFASKPLDIALREFLQFIEIKGEAQVVSRILEKFANRYITCNASWIAEKFQDSDVIHLLVFAVMMLNTDLHNMNNKKKISLREFVHNLRGCDSGSDLADTQMLADLYERIRAEPLRAGSDHVTQVLKMEAQLYGRHPPLAEPHRRLVCFCKLSLVKDWKGQTKPRQSERAVFLFNDMLIVTKCLERKRRVFYQYRGSLGLHRMQATQIRTHDLPFELVQVSFSVPDRLQLSYPIHIVADPDGCDLDSGGGCHHDMVFAARNFHDRSRFCDDLVESIHEVGDMRRFERSLFAEPAVSQHLQQQQVLLHHSQVQQQHPPTCHHPPQTRRSRASTRAEQRTGPVPGSLGWSLNTRARQQQEQAASSWQEQAEAPAPTALRGCVDPHVFGEAAAPVPVARLQADVVRGVRAQVEHKIFGLAQAFATVVVPLEVLQPLLRLVEHFHPNPVVVHICLDVVLPAQVVAVPPVRRRSADNLGRRRQRSQPDVDFPTTQTVLGCAGDQSLVSDFVEVAEGHDECGVEVLRAVALLHRQARRLLGAADGVARLGSAGQARLRVGGHLQLQAQDRVAGESNHFVQFDYRSNCGSAELSAEGAQCLDTRPVSDGQPDDARVPVQDAHGSILDQRVVPVDPENPQDVAGRVSEHGPVGGQGGGHSAQHHRQRGDIACLQSNVQCLGADLHRHGEVSGPCRFIPAQSSQIPTGNVDARIVTAPELGGLASQHVQRRCSVCHRLDGGCLGTEASAKGNQHGSSVLDEVQRLKRSGAQLQPHATVRLSWRQDLVTVGGEVVLGWRRVRAGREAVVQQQAAGVQLQLQHGESLARAEDAVGQHRSLHLAAFVAGTELAGETVDAERLKQLAGWMVVNTSDLRLAVFLVVGRNGGFDLFQQFGSLLRIVHQVVDEPESDLAVVVVHVQVNHVVPCHGLLCPGAVQPLAQAVAHVGIGGALLQQLLRPGEHLVDRPPRRLGAGKQPAGQAQPDVDEGLVNRLEQLLDRPRKAVRHQLEAPVGVSAEDGRIGVESQAGVLAHVTQHFGLLRRLEAEHVRVDYALDRVKVEAASAGELLHVVRIHQEVDLLAEREVNMSPNLRRQFSRKGTALRRNSCPLPISGRPGTSGGTDFCEIRNLPVGSPRPGSLDEEQKLHRQRHEGGADAELPGRQPSQQEAGSRQQVAALSQDLAARLVSGVHVAKDKAASPGENHQSARKSVDTESRK
uniref:SAM-dependent MTase TRM10-type domain-containing protein n=1 Tax=Macrostomum lignano TaxID=282301 RepID=A0A1I8HP68_9PLAT